MKQYISTPNLPRRLILSLLSGSALAACSAAEVTWFPDRQRKALFERGIKRVALLGFPPYRSDAAEPDVRYLVFEDRAPLVREFRVGPAPVVVTRDSGGWRQLFPVYDTVMRAKETYNASRQVTRALASVAGDPYGRFSQQLVASLRDSGLDVVQRNVRDPAASRASQLQGLPPLDAVIEQQASFSFVRANRKEPYLATLDVDFRLLSGDPGQRGVLGVQQWSGSLAASEPPMWPQLQRLLDQPKAALDQLMALADGYADYIALALRNERAWTSNDA